MKDDFYRTTAEENIIAPGEGDELNQFATPHFDVPMTKSFT